MEQITVTLKDLAQRLINPLHNWLNGLDQRAVILAALLVLLVFVFRKPLTRTAIRFIVTIGEKIGLMISADVQETIKPAIQALIVSLTLLIGIEALGLPETISKTLEKILSSVAVAAVFVALYWLVDVVARRLSDYRTTRTAIQVDWLVMLAKILVGVLGGAAVLKIWTIDIGPALTGMGVLGAGVALAAQDLFKNLLAGFTNIHEKRFQVGDWIRVDGVIEGTVEKVDLRSALIRRFDMAPVHVPNAELANATLTNFSRLPHRRVRLEFGVVYSATEDQLSQITSEIEAFIAESSDIAPKSEVSNYVRINDFNTSSVDILVNCFTQSPDFAGYMEIKEKLILAIKQAVENAGSSFAFPTRVVHVETTSDDLPNQSLATGDA